MLFGKKPPLRIRLLEVMSLRRAFPRDDDARDFEAAKQRCLSCHMTALCDEALQKGDAAAFSRFCPNCGFLQAVQRRSLEF